MTVDCPENFRDFGALGLYSAALPAVTFVKASILTL